MDAKSVQEDISVIEPLEILPYVDRVVTDFDIPELQNRYSGKVRENFDIDNQHRLMVATDRLSAFDQPVAAIPFKGEVLTSIARFWFDQTEFDYVEHHVINYPDVNVMVVQKLDMIPVEIVVRDYLAGSTATSLATLYQQGLRSICGVRLPDGLFLHEKLPETIITPTTKSDVHDEPISPKDAIARGLVTAEEWEEITEKALALFQRGQEVCARRGVILVDTKYEFGRHPDGYIMLADEIHTPDSSRFWLGETYQARFGAGLEPENFDKDIVRRWIAARCDPYHDTLPTVPREVIAETAAAYIGMYERLTGSPYTINTNDTDPTARIMGNVRFYLNEHYPCVL